MMITNYSHPGLHPLRLAKLMQAAVDRCQIDLSGLVVFTEAATGSYVVTPILAALAGAEHVYALTRSTRYGTAEAVKGNTLELARLLGVQDRIEVIEKKSQSTVSQADIITNSGHVRPIDAQMISWIKDGAVIPLMYEAWEFRAEDIDLSACRKKGILTAGTNECLPNIDVFSVLGVMAIKQLLDAGIAINYSSILLLCDNPFRPFIEQSLRNIGARVDVFNSLSEIETDSHYDAILVALQPQPDPVLQARDAERLANSMPETAVIQFWGDIDRPAFEAAGVSVWPAAAPAPGHMGILLSDVGPDAVIRLQSGGLKVGEILARRKFEHSPADQAYLQWLESSENA